MTNSAAINAFAAAEKTVLDSLVTALNGIATGVKALDDLITTLQNSPGTITAADQATLDAMQTQSKAILAQVAAINTAPPGTVIPPARKP